MPLQEMIAQYTMIQLKIITKTYLYDAGRMFNHMKLQKNVSFSAYFAFCFEIFNLWEGDTINHIIILV